MAVSFSANAKAEICKSIPKRQCCALAQCFGVLLFCNSFGADGIRIVTECREFAASLPKLFRKAFNIGFDVIPGEDAVGNKYDCACSAIWTEPQKLQIKVQIIDKYFGNGAMTFSFKDSRVGICMAKNAEAFLCEYEGVAVGFAE